jgi:phage terminase Nu1 subunit (DNA packaging protein)
MASKGASQPLPPYSEWESQYVPTDVSGEQADELWAVVEHRVRRHWPRLTDNHVEKVTNIIASSALRVARGEPVDWDAPRQARDLIRGMLKDDNQPF